jgi:Ser/Thr protein kinase RdoA (MazF antagonist)
VEEQTATTNEMSRNVAEAAKGSGEIAKNIAGVASAAGGTTSGAADTQKAARELGEMAATLQKLVSKFNLDRSDDPSQRNWSRQERQSGGRTKMRLKENTAAAACD